MSPAPKVSIVVPAHDAATTLAAQLDAIAAGLPAAPPTEILVVDNRSTDDTAATAEAWATSTGAPVRVVDASERAGEPYARNVGLAAARGELILYCDADDIVRPTWIAAMAAGLRDAHYVTGPIDMHDLNEPWIADVRGTSVTEGRSLLWDAIPYAHGCNMGFRTPTLRALGGFNETYTAACDLDIAIRMHEAGHDLAFVDDATIAYRLRPSLGATYRQGVFYGRYRVPIRRRLASTIDVGSPFRQGARRTSWLVRKAIPSLWSKRTRARWVWVAGQLVGELRGAPGTVRP